MKKIALFLSLFLLFGAGISFAAPKKTIYAVAKTATPVLYTSDFAGVFGGKDGSSLKFDDYGEIDEVEFVALPDTVFRVLGAVKNKGNIILRVETNDYPYPNDTGHYIDARFVRLTTTLPVDRVAKLPSKEAISASMLAMKGAPYTWGGNVNAGIPSLLRYYKPKTTLSADMQSQWMLKGVDCSGLLYQATNGYIPRNTSTLVDYGKGLEIAGKSAKEIASMLKLLDLIVWKGHLIIVLDDTQVIESRHDYDTETAGFQWGVRVRNTLDVLEDVLSKRVAVNNYADEVAEGKKKFVVRRWFVENTIRLEAK